MTFLNVPVLIWAALAFAMAVVWVIVYPKQRNQEMSSTKAFFLRWGHALCWFMIALNFAIRAIDPNLAILANLVAIGSLGAYIGFIFGLMGNLPRLAPKKED